MKKFQEVYAEAVGKFAEGPARLDSKKTTLRELKMAPLGSRLDHPAVDGNGMPIAYAKRGDTGWTVYCQDAYRDSRGRTYRDRRVNPSKNLYQKYSTYASDKIQEALEDYAREFQASARGLKGAEARALKSPPAGPGYKAYAKAFADGWRSALEKSQSGEDNEAGYDAALGAAWKIHRAATKKFWETY